MKIRRFYVDDMHEGMLRIRKEMGPEAVIIQSRRVRQKGIRGIFAPRKVEITAAVDNNLLSGNTVQIFEEKLEEKFGNLINLVGRLAQQGGKELSSKNGEDDIGYWRKRLAEEDINQSIIDKLINDMEENFSCEVKLTREVIELILRKKLAQFIRTAPEKEKPVMVFVGPTGVGKTTTLAKLAARFALEQEENIGLITIDHYRIGAVEQLRTYAEITGLPLEAVMTPRELPLALERLSGCNRILIDTAGRGFKNSMQIGELSSYLQELPPAEIFLVMSATTKAHDVEAIVKNFQRLNFNRLIFTKLDETQSYGTILNGAYFSQLPVIYLTTGQSVPDDLEVADTEKICNLVLGVENYG